MKTKTLSTLLCLLFLTPFSTFFGCKYLHSDNPKEGSDLIEALHGVKVGMTYEEVENLLGKPVAIFKGHSVLVGENMKHSTITDRHVSIDRGGQLVETSWSYSLSKVETTYYSIPHDTTYIDGTIPNRLDVNKYYLNGSMEIDYDSYRKIKEAISSGDNQPKWAKVYLLGDGTYFAVLWHNSDGAIEVKKLDLKHKDTIIKYVPRHVHKELEPYKLKCIVKFIYVIVFDSSSGRVTTFGFQPIDVIYS